MDQRRRGPASDIAGLVMGLLLPLLGCSSSNVCGLGQGCDDCTSDAGPVVCATGLTCVPPSANLACAQADPDCNADRYQCVLPDGGTGG